MPFPDVCVAERNSSGDSSDIPILSVPTGGRKTFELVVKDGHCEDASVVDLTSVSRVRFVANEEYQSTVPYIDKNATITDAANGEISLELRAASLPYAGMYHAGIMVYDASDEVIHQSRMWLDVRKAMDHTLPCNSPLTIMEVRSFLWDRCPSDNFLLDDVQFSDSQIAAAIVWPVNEWNETPPPINTYTPATFPFRYHWLMGSAAHLLRSAAYNYSRNNLSYNAGGSSVNDKDKGPHYIQLAKELEDKWHEWMLHKKYQMNLDLCYGGIRAPEFEGYYR